MLKESSISDEMGARCVKAIASSEQKLSFLVESFIKMSRFENHLIQIKRSSDDLRQTVLDIVTQLYAKATQKRIEIAINQAGEIKYPHDPNWLGEAIYNILDNSIKYAPINSNIMITLEQNEMFTQIVIRDYGKGIEIGLYLSREIISQHSDVIKVHRENPGLSTSIYLED